MALLSVVLALCLGVAVVCEPPASPPPPARTKANPPASDTVRALADPRKAADAEWSLVRDYPVADALASLVPAIQSDPAFAAGKPARVAAYAALARIGEARIGIPRPTDKGQIALLIAGLSEPDERIRAKSAGALAGVPGPDRGDMKQPLADALADSSPFVVTTALSSLRTLALKEPAPPEVWAIAATPSAQLKERWAKVQSPLVSDKSPFDAEVQMRLSAMTVIAAWEGLARLYAPNVYLDLNGTRARALTAAFMLDVNTGRSGVTDAGVRSTMFNEMVTFFKDSPAVTLVETGIVSALLKAAVNEETPEARSEAKSALQRCGEGVSPNKQDLVKQALSGLP